MLNNLVRWTEARVSSRIPDEPFRRRRRIQYLSAVLYGFVGYQIPAIIAFVGVAMGNDTYGYLPFVLLYLALTFASILIYGTVLLVRNFRGKFVLAMTLAQLGFWLVELTLFIYFMHYLRPVVLLCTLLVINHLIIVGEMLACFVLTILTVLIYIAVTTYSVQVAGQPYDLAMETVTIIGFLTISLYLAYMGVRLRKSRDRLQFLAKNLENTQQNLRATLHQLEDSASKDVLTGLRNRRAAMDILAEVYAAARSGSQKATLFLLDIDHFKSINDQYGHACGDHVLRTVASIFKEHARENDLVARWGGEEFLLVFRGIDMPQARKIAERLRREVSEHIFHYKSSALNVTLSGGLAELGGVENPEDGIALADKHLYSAKHNGRNQIRPAAVNECTASSTT